MNETNELTNMGMDIGIHVFILFTFLSIFFVFYVSKLAKSALSSELKDNIDKTVSDKLNSINPMYKPIVKQALNKIPFEELKQNYIEENENVALNNQWLFRMIVIIDVFLLSLIVLSNIILYKSCNQNVPLKHILTINGIIFLFVGIVEYLFFTNVAVKYVPTEPSLIITSTLNSLKKHISA